MSLKGHAQLYITIINNLINELINDNMVSTRFPILHSQSHSTLTWKDSLWV